MFFVESIGLLIKYNHHLLYILNCGKLPGENRFLFSINTLYKIH